MKTSIIILVILAGNLLYGQNAPKQDVISTDNGDLIINFVGHGSLYFEFDGKVIHVDPVSNFGSYDQFPKADLIFITHQHGDHLHAETISLISKTGTNIVFTKKCADNFSGEGTVVKNGDKSVLQGVEFEAVPAYNIKNTRDNGQVFHPKGEGNGYVFIFGNKRIYVAGDTENVPEMKNLKDIDIAFLPMNLPYTMTPEMVANAADLFKPKVLYPYHFGNTNTSELLDLMKDKTYCEVKIRDMK